MSAGAARRLWAIVPGGGKREGWGTAGGPAVPKQYIPLLGRSVLEWSLRALLTESRIHGIVVVLANGDTHWPDVAKRIDSPKLLTVIGGAQRQHSVSNGLEFLASLAQADDWVLVHVAARPCLSGCDVRALAAAHVKNTTDA